MLTSRPLTFGSLVFAALITIGTATAQTATYTYSGRSYVISPPPTSTGTNAISFSLPTALAPNANDVFIAPTTWKMSNGRDTISPSPDNTFVGRVWTDASGNVASWLISAFNKTGLRIDSCFIPYQCAYDLTQQVKPDATIIYTGSASTPGTWVKSIQPSPVSVSTQELRFTTVQGGTAPTVQTLVIGASTPGITVIQEVSSLPNWLRLSYSGSTAPVSVQASVDATGLNSGAYTTQLAFHSSANTTPVVVTVTLLVTSPIAFKLTSSAVQFQSTVGSVLPPPAQAIQVMDTVDGGVQASISTTATWLTANVVTAVTPFNLVLSVAPLGLGTGTFKGQVLIKPMDSTKGIAPQLVDVQLTVVPDERPIITTVTNAASFKPVIGPGTWISLIGDKFSKSTAQAGTALLPTSLSGVAVQVSGPSGRYDALVQYVSPTQVNAFVPHEVGDFVGSVSVTVTTATGATAFTAPYAPVAPALFSYGPEKYAAAVVYPDGAILGISPGTMPASAGKVVALYGTGFGQVTPPVHNVNGAVSPLPLAAAPEIQVGGKPVTVLWSGMVGVGLYQFNIEIPSEMQAGDYAVIIRIGSVQADSVTLPIR